METSESVTSGESPSSTKADSLPFQVVALYKPRGITVEQASLPSDSVPGCKRKLNDWLREAEDKFLQHGSKPLNAVGRLDKDTSGLLFLTNDGKLHEQILRPGLLEKVYEATIKRPAPAHVTDQELKQLLDGIELTDGFACASAVEIVEESTSTVWKVPSIVDREQYQAAKKAKWAKKQASKLVAKDEKRANISNLHCLCCGSSTHRKDECSQKHATCTNCWRQGHVAEVCFHKSSNNNAKKILGDSMGAPLQDLLCEQKPDPIEVSTISAPMQDLLLDPPPDPIEVSTTISVVRITVAVGRNRVVRRLLAAAGLPVYGLHRVQIGPLHLVRDLQLVESQMTLLNAQQEDLLRRSACRGSLE